MHVVAKQERVWGSFRPLVPTTSLCCFFERVARVATVVIQSDSQTKYSGYVQKNQNLGGSSNTTVACIPTWYSWGYSRKSFTAGGWRCLSGLAAGTDSSDPALGFVGLLLLPCWNPKRSLGSPVLVVHCLESLTNVYRSVGCGRVSNLLWKVTRQS